MSSSNHAPVYRVVEDRRLSIFRIVLGENHIHAFNSILLVVHFDNIARRRWK
jgi:hypothetical protein